MSWILNRWNMKNLSLGSVFCSSLDTLSYPFWKLRLSCSCIWRQHKMLLMWNNKSFKRDYQWFGYEQTNILWSPTTATSQQKGTSESSHIYCIKHIFRLNNVSLIIPVIGGGPWPSFILSLQCEMCKPWACSICSWVWRQSHLSSRTLVFLISRSLVHNNVVFSCDYQVVPPFFRAGFSTAPWLLTGSWEAFWL